MCILLQDYGHFSATLLLSSSLMRNRKGVDWSRPMKAITTRQKFDQLVPNDYLSPRPPKHPEGQTADLRPAKDGRITPQVEVVQRLSEAKVYKILPSYARFSTKDTPLPQNYELSQLDLAFIKLSQTRFKLNGLPLITQDLLAKAITFLELKADRTTTLPRNQDWITQFLQQEYPENHQAPQVGQLMSTIYNYWLQRRNEAKTPLLPALLRPRPHQFNPLLPYNPREREKRSLRRNSRIDQLDILEQLSQEFELAAKIVRAVQKREDLKLKKVCTQMRSFYSECKEVAALPAQLQDTKDQGSHYFQNKFKYLVSNRVQGWKKQEAELPNRESTAKEGELSKEGEVDNRESNCNQQNAKQG